MDFWAGAIWATISTVLFTWLMKTAGCARLFFRMAFQLVVTPFSIGRPVGRKTQSP